LSDNNQVDETTDDLKSLVDSSVEKVKRGIPRHVYILIAVAMVMTSFASILIRYAGEGITLIDPTLTPADATVIAFWRLLFATIGMFIVTLVSRNLKQFKKVKVKRDLPLLALSGLMLAIHFATWNLSLQITNIASSMTIVYLMPFFALILSFIFLKEKVSWAQFGAIIIAMVGAIVVGLSPLLISDDTGSIRGDLIALVGGISAAAYFVIGRKMRERLDIFSYATIVYGICTVCLLMFILAYPQARHKIIDDLRWWHFLFFGLLALGPSCLGHTLYNYSLGFVKAPVITVTALGEMFGATILAYAFFRERPSWLVFIGMAFVATGIIITVIFENKAMKKQLETPTAPTEKISEG
jgi:drug/metabolite transporter (DMT)-like permease